MTPEEIDRFLNRINREYGTPEERLARIERERGTPEEQLAAIHRRYGTPEEQLAEMERRWSLSRSIEEQDRERARRSAADRRFTRNMIIFTVVFFLGCFGGSAWLAAHHHGGGGRDDPALEYLLGYIAGFVLSQATHP